MESILALQAICAFLKLNRRHATWVEFLQAYNFTIMHKAGVHNVVADALRHALVTSMQVQVVGFDVLKELYEEDADFGEIWKLCTDKPFKDFVRMDGFLFKGKTLCIPSFFFFFFWIIKNLFPKRQKAQTNTQKHYTKPKGNPRKTKNGQHLP